MVRRLRFLQAILCLGLAGTLHAQAGVLAVLTQHNNAARTGEFVGDAAEYEKRYSQDVR